MKKSILTLPILFLLASPAMAEDAVIYSYAKTAQKPAEWAIIPVIADVPDTSPATLFDALRRKKLPTYGSTAYDAAKKVVQIDETKCAYGSIISAEIGQTFEAHGHAQPQYTCAGKSIPPAKDALPHHVPIIPLWQALSANKIESPAIIQVGDEFLSISEYTSRLKKQDKALVKAIERDFEDPNLFVKSGAMKGYVTHRFPGAEKRIAKELNTANAGNISAAMAALAGSKDAAITAQMKTILQKKDSQQEAYALSMLDAASDELRNESILILLCSANDANFNKAVSVIESSRKYDILRSNAELILSASTSQHAEKVAEMLISQGNEQLLAQWLKQTASSDAAQSAAAKALSQTKSPELRQIALSMQLTHTSPDTAFDALDALQADKNSSNADVWKRGMTSPHFGIAIASFEKLDELGEIAAKTSKGSAYLEETKAHPIETIPKLMADAYNADVKVREDIAYTVKWMDGAGDSLRTILIKDAEELIASKVIIQTAHRPAEEIPLTLIREMTARAERSPKVKIALLHAIPHMMNEKTTQTLVAYAGNEMFDGDVSVKIAAIRSLSEIARQTQDPVIADNAVTSLALTAQDKSESIVHHTLSALERTGLPAAREILDKFK